MAWYENATSCAVIGCPSDQVKSSRMTTLSYIRSALLSQLTTCSAAANGIKFQSLANRLKPINPTISISDARLIRMGLLLLISIVMCRLKVASQSTSSSLAGKRPRALRIFALFGMEVFCNFNASATVASGFSLACFARSSSSASSTGCFSHLALASRSASDGGSNGSASESGFAALAAGFAVAFLLS